MIANFSPVRKKLEKQKFSNYLSLIVVTFFPFPSSILLKNMYDVLALVCRGGNEV